MSLRPLVDRVYKEFGALLTKDFPKFNPSILPTRRGTFNVYKQFSVENPWQKYLEIPDRELTTWEKLDKAFILAHRNLSRYAQYGLVLDDVLNDEDPVVIEAINRLPKDVKDARIRRITRAFDLNVNGKILPKSEWTPIEDDVPYLRPYVLWVENEMEEYDAERYTHIHVPIPPYGRVSADAYDHGQVFKTRQLNDDV
jgi:ubiquinol-cytochrome c reductase subunit 7